MQPTLVEHPPDDAEWLSEIKWDGYRTHIAVAEGRAHCFTRRGHDWTKRYQHVADEAARLPCTSALLDGEMILANSAGASDFGGLQEVIGAQPQRLTFVAFDLLQLDGSDLRRWPLTERRNALDRLIGRSGDAVHFSQSLPGTPAQVFALAEQAGLEGIVCKRSGSRYASGRTRDWLKVKCFDEAEFALLGVRRQPGKPAMALIGRDGRHVGNAFIVLAGRKREQLWALAEASIGSPPKGVSGSGTIEWLRPSTVARVRYLRDEKALRHATLRDWRDGVVSPEKGQ